MHTEGFASQNPCRHLEGQEGRLCVKLATRLFQTQQVQPLLEPLPKVEAVLCGLLLWVFQLRLHALAMSRLWLVAATIP